jgi:hypothetical protein
VTRDALACLSAHSHRKYAPPLDRPMNASAAHPRASSADRRAGALSVAAHKARNTTAAAIAQTLTCSAG